MEPSLSSSSSITIVAAPLSPLSPHPERSMSHESQAMSLSSIPITPADDGVDAASIASATDPLDTTSLVPPIRLEEIAKQLSSDSPIEHFHSPDPTTLRFPPGDRDSSVYSDDDSVPNPRISVASSDNGGVNIGLSLLQGLGGGDDSDSDEEQFAAIRRVQSPESTLELPVSMSAGSESHYSESPNDTTQFALVAPVEGPREPVSARSESQYSESPRSATQPLDPPLTSQSERSESNYSDSPVSTRAPLPPAADPSARPESEYDFGEDWEGADDIYDQYRYSQYSMASWMSRMSKGSMHTIGSVSWDPPPVPTPAERPSIESNRERKGSKGKIPSRLAESTTQADVEATADVDEEASSSLSKMQKNRPAPLTFRKESEPSPLLHATFGSPQASPTAPSATSGSFASPTLVDPVYPMNAGAATNNRKRREDEEDSEDEDEQSRRSRQELAVPGRDNGMPMSAMSQAAEIVNGHLPAAQQSPPPTPAIPPLSPRSAESSAALEKRRLAVANADPTDEPPYSSSATPVASASASTSASASHAPTPTTSPPPGNPVVMPPPGHPTHPTARPIDPNRQPVHPMMRQSLFMPHPGAPKPAVASLGPMYGRPNQPAPNQPFPPHVGPPTTCKCRFYRSGHAREIRGESLISWLFGLSALENKGNDRLPTNSDACPDL
ncbi:hypothetical protein L226DRAFT_347131 [Lentinus tigrinus ALCF2SS1-7]|uniref:uncharacterized protein n=1 Tax=Lentinus tigrinus ALCF2SS1-7 TaxID=1328758 RepID=UPI00116601B4|nr:hypothetical protein L226DRAFT_347131 [Lentinus tigrinus ALCF2SS1-7]